MKQQKFFKIMSLLGGLFVLYLVVGYIYTLKTRGDVILNQVSVPKEFSRHFDRVVTRKRFNPMPNATFMSPEGRRVNWEVFDGKYLLVNFWATWCAPCVLELPSLDKLRKQFDGRGLEVIAISIDTRRGQDDIKAFLDNRGIGEFAAYLDDVGEIQKNIYMRGIPTSYLLGPKGNVLYVFEGDAPWDALYSVDFFKSVVNQNLE